MAQPNYKCRFISILILLLTQSLLAQNVDFQNLLTGSPLKVSGAINANSIYYSSSQNSARAPFTYFVQGSLTASIYQFSMPISYSYSNQGEQFTHQVPFDFNRLSLHPKYKWIQGHIGDVSMTFSPYTLSGHQFTGGGLDLSPKGSITFSAMSGRLLKATEDDEEDATIPAFKRMGYGVNLGIKQKTFNLNLIGFYAKDDLNSIAVVPEEKNVLPKENLVLSASGSYQLSKNFTLKGEYANTAITQDIRSETINEGEGITSLFFNNRNSTEFYTAYNAGLDYSFDKYVVGIGYERIDPGYETLGAYFFNNDFENITVNMTTNFFKGKVSLALNLGYQRDDLENQKEQATSRNVGSVNTTFNVSEKLTISGSYSNFTTFTNANIDQFELINDDSLLDNTADALDYKQLSQNANVNINYILAKKEKVQQNINFNYALADVYNEQGGVVRIGDASTFHNFNTTHTLSFLKKKLNITTAFNATFNTVGLEDATTFGPTLGISKRFLDNKLNTGFSASYNNSNTSTGVAEVTNFRANASYIYKEKHNLNLNAIQLFRSSVADVKSNDLTITFGYNYSFDLGAPKFNKRQPKDKLKKDKTKASKEVEKDIEEVVGKTKEKKEKELEFSYRTHIFKGTHEEITRQVLELEKLEEFKDLHFKSIEDNLGLLAKNIKNNESNSKGKYKKSAIDYLDYLYKHKNFINKYHKLVYKSLKELHNEVSVISYSLEKKYLDLLGVISEKQKKQSYISEEELQTLRMRELKNKAHKWMVKNLEHVSEEDIKQDTGILSDFKDKYISDIFLMDGNGKSDREIEMFLLVKLAGFYHKNYKED